MYCSNKELIYLGLDKKIQVYLSKDMAERPKDIKVIRLNDLFECSGDWEINENSGLGAFTFRKGHSIGHYYLVE